MKIAIFSPYSLPELGACSLRVDSFKKYFENNKIETAVYSPKRLEIKNNITPKNYYRYSKITEIIKIILNNDFDLVIGTGPPLTHAFFALIAAKFKRIPFITDLRDPWTREAERLGIYKKTNPKLWLYKIIEFLSYNLSDRVFVVTDELKRISAKKTVNKSKIIVIPNGSNSKMFKYNKLKGIEVRKQLGIPLNAVVGLYGGAFIRKDVDVMLKHLAQTIKKTGLYLLLVLPANNKNEIEEIENLKKISKNLGIIKKIKFVNFKDNFGFNKISEYYSAANFGLNPLPFGMDDYCIPVKTYDYFACELPVVVKANSQGELAKLIEKNKVGWFSSDWGGFTENVRLAVESKDLKKIGKRARELIITEFDRIYSNKKALKIIEKIINKN